MTNNPFMENTTNAAFSARFPDISSPSPPNQSQYTSWLGPQQPQPPSYPSSFQQQPQQWAPNGGYAPGPSSPPYQSYGYQQPQQSSGLMSQPTGYPGPSTGYNSGSGFMGGGYGQQPQSQQQLQPQYTAAPGYLGSSYSYLQQPQQQSQSQNPPYSSLYLSEFDPLSQQQQQQQQQQQSQYQPQQSSYSQPQYNQQQYQSPTSTSPASHPRQYIASHKAELESWDRYSWKQLQNAFDALKTAWERRKNECQAQLGALGQSGWFYGIEQERGRVAQLIKEADMHFDSVSASSFQLHEALLGYRQSLDPASKRRVREAVNAAVSSLPDWPPQGGV